MFDIYDYQDEHNLVSDSIRKTELKKLLKICPIDEVGVWQRFGRIYDRHKQHDSALFYYFKALKQVNVLKQYVYLNSVLINIGNVYIEMDQYDKAKQYYNLDTIKRLENLDSANIALFYYNRSDLYRKMHQFEQANFNYKMAENYTDLTDINEKLSLGFLKSDIYREQGNYKSAYSVVNDLYNYRFYQIYEEYRVILYHQYAFTYSFISKDSSISRIADTAIILARNLNNESRLSRTLADMSIVYSNIGYVSKAFASLYESKSINDRLNNFELKSEIGKAEFAIQQDLAKKELILQKERMSLQNAKLYISLLAITLLLLISIIGFLYYRQRQKINKQNLQIKDAELNQVIREQELSFLNAQLSGQINERKRIATELHNSLGNRLASIKLGFESLGINKTSSQQEMEKIFGLNEQIDEACSKLRLISHVQYDQAWLHELQQRLNAISQTHGVKTTLIDNGINLSNNMQLEMDLYTISEGLLSNSIKHSGASEITIQINQIDNNISYSYEDNGKGFQSEILDQSDGIGYRILKERVAYHKGRWNLDTAPGQGMIIFIEFPLTL